MIPTMIQTPIGDKTATDDGDYDDDDYDDYDDDDEDEEVREPTDDIGEEVSIFFTDSNISSHTSLMGLAKTGSLIISKYS